MTDKNTPNLGDIKGSSPSRQELNEARKGLEDSWHFDTRAILKSQAPDPATGATIFPIFKGGARFTAVVCFCETLLNCYL